MSWRAFWRVTASASERKVPKTLKHAMSCIFLKKKSNFRIVFKTTTKLNRSWRKSCWCLCGSFIAGVLRPRTPKTRRQEACERQKVSCKKKTAHKQVRTNSQQNEPVKKCADGVARILTALNPRSLHFFATHIRCRTNGGNVSEFGAQSLQFLFSPKKFGDDLLFKLACNNTQRVTHHCQLGKFA